MSSNENFYELQSSYMHKDFERRETKKNFNGLEIFMYQADSTPITYESGMMLCLYQKCKSTKFVNSQ